MTDNLLSDAEIAHYRRDGYVVVRGVLPPELVEDCKAALSALAQGTIERRGAGIYYEAGAEAEGLSPEQRELRVRRFDNFCDAHPALLAAAMAPRLHAAIDALCGRGRTLFQEMALVKPPEIGAEKPWHQDAAYFLIRDPALVVGTWIALDRATEENGCMQMAAGSHLRGPVPHIAEGMVRCYIGDADRDRSRVVPLPMEPGDAVIFHGLLQHFTAPNRSAHRRRALQYHFAQSGAVWGTVEDHARLYGDGHGGYRGCVVPAMPAEALAIMQGKRQRPVSPPAG